MDVQIFTLKDSKDVDFELMKIVLCGIRFDLLGTIKMSLYEPLCKVSSNFYHFKCWRPWDSKRDVLAWFCINCLGKLISFESLLSDIWPSRGHKKGPHIILGIKFLITLIMLCVKGSKSWLYNNNSVIFVSIYYKDSHFLNLCRAIFDPVGAIELSILDFCLQKP